MTRLPPFEGPERDRSWVRETSSSADPDSFADDGITSESEVEIGGDYGYGIPGGGDVLATGAAPDAADGPDRVSLRLEPYASPLATPGESLTSWGAWTEVEGIPVLAVGHHDGRLRLWNSDGSLRAEVADAHARRSVVRAMGGRQGEVVWGAWHVVQGSPVLATGGLDGRVRVWGSDGSLRWEAQEEGRPLGGAEVNWGAWTPHSDTAVLATGHANGAVRLWNGAGGSLISRLEADAGQSFCGAWQPNTASPLLATGYREDGIHLWTADGTALGRDGVTDDGPVRWCAWAPGQQDVLATGKHDGTVTLWDVKDGSIIGEPARGGGNSLWGSWFPVADLPVLGTGAQDGSVALWNPDGTHRGGRDVGGGGSARNGAWSPVTDYPVLATGTAGGHVHLVDGEGNPTGPPSRCHLGSVNWLTWTTIEGVPVLTTGGNDRTVRSWRLVRDVVRPSSAYRSDSTHGATDALDRTREAAALADVITARSAQPPLAIGVFGHWGDGKSQFLEMLHEAVERRARFAAADDPVSHTHVRQVRFNAWHYTETDLWASLVAELFTQLGEPSPTGDRKKQQRQQSRLAGDLVNARGLHEKLAATEERAAELRAAYTPPAPAWSAVAPEIRDRLSILAGSRAEKLFDDAARAPHDLYRITLSTRRLLTVLPPRWVALAAGCIVLALVLAFVAPHLLQRATEGWLAVAALPGVVAVAALLGAVSAASVRLKAALPVVREALTRTVRHADAANARIADAIDRTEAEARQLRRSLQDLTAAGQLAGIVSDRTGDARYRQHLGLMSEIRQDFGRMAELLLSQSETVAANDEALLADAAGDTLPQIKRIVLYIDDLDRCPPARVVDVLEAIHLLLAVPLFVVVVAVDPRWLLRSLTSHYRELFTPAHSTPATVPQPFPDPLHGASAPDAGGPQEVLGGDLSVDPGEEEVWASTPAQYLEKIFQIVLTLPPMQRSGYQNMIDELLAVRATPGRSGRSDASTGTGTGTSAPGPGPGPGRTASTDAGLRPTPLRISTLADVPLVPRLDPLAVTDDELRFLGLLGPPLISSPRSVKRLANSYGLLAALTVDATGERRQLRPHDLPDPDGSPAYPYRAAATLLATVIGHPASGPALFLHLHHTADRDDPPTWTDYLHSLRPRRTRGAWNSPLEGSVSAGRARQTHALLDALQGITAAARAVELALPLPERLEVWAEWIVPVGRLSFPTGSAVSRLITPDAERAPRQPGDAGTPP